MQNSQSYHRLVLSGYKFLPITFEHCPVSFFGYDNYSTIFGSAELENGFEKLPSVCFEMFAFSKAI